MIEVVFLLVFGPLIAFVTWRAMVADLRDESEKRAADEAGHLRRRQGP